MIQIGDLCLLTCFRQRHWDTCTTVESPFELLALNFAAGKNQRYTTNWGGVKISRQKSRSKNLAAKISKAKISNGKNLACQKSRKKILFTNNSLNNKICTFAWSDINNINQNETFFLEIKKLSV